MATPRPTPALLLLACSIGCMASGGPADTGAGPAAEAPLVVTTLTEGSLTPIPVIPSGPIIAENVNITLVVADPVQTARAIEAIVSDGGGRLSNLGTSADSGSLNAEIPPQALGRIRQGIARLPGTVVNENVSSNDYGPSLTPLRERLEKLALSETHLDQVMRATTDRKLFEALLVQRELSARERDSARQQIASMLEQTRMVRLYLTLQVSGVAPTILKER